MEVTKKRICFICLGNICRSPLAEGIFRHLVKEAGLEAVFEVESAGTGNYHVGEQPDRRAQAVARTHSVRLSGRARQFQPGDFGRFDHILAMDRENLDDLRRLARTETERKKIQLLRDYDPEASDEAGVPDPYYGGPDGFERVYQIIERSCRGLLKALC